MAKIDIRNLEGDFTVDEIQFGEDETLVAASFGDDSDIFYVRSDSKLVPVYLDSIDNMISALQQAKALWADE